MAAPSTQIDTTSVTELVPTEEIGTWLDGYNYPARVGILVAASIPGIGSIPMRSPRWDQLTPTAGTKAEGDDASQVEMTTAEESATPGIVIFETALTDEVVAGRRGIREAHLIEAMASLGNRIDSDILAVSTSSVNTMGSTAQVFNRQFFSAFASAYRALDIPEGAMMDHAAVLHHDAVRDLDEDEVLTAAARAVAPQFQVLGAAAGYKGAYGGLQLFESGNVAAESSGWSNFATPIGAGRSGLMFVVSRPPQVEENRGRDGARAQSTYYVFSAWYGAGMRNRLRLQEAVSRT